MRRKKKEETGAQVTPATEAGEVEIVEQYKWYYFCGKGHIGDVQNSIKAEDPIFYCSDCGLFYSTDNGSYVVQEKSQANAVNSYMKFCEVNGIDHMNSCKSMTEDEVRAHALEQDQKSGEQTLNQVQGDKAPVVEQVYHQGYAPGGSEIIQYIGIEQLRESPTNPRRHYDEKGLNDLAESIKAKGVVQNLVVRAVADSGTDSLPAKERQASHAAYEIVAGSRRYRAAKIAQLKALPCVVRSYSDAEVLEIQVIENNQREDVHPLEEGEGYAMLLKVEGYTVEAIAGKIGRSDKYVRERLQLAKLAPKVKESYESNIINYTHARLFARLTNDQQEAALNDLVRTNYQVNRRYAGPVKQLEYWIKNNVEKSLAGCSFPLDDATINKQAGACNVCQFNTATDMQLFPEYGVKGVCMKPECFQQKVKAYGERQIREKLKADASKELLLVSKRNYSNTLKKMADGTERVVVGYDNFEKAKKSEKGAVEALLMGSQDMEDKGKTIYVKLKNKKDAKPAKNERRSVPSSSGEDKKALSPEEQAEYERKREKESYEKELYEVLVADEILKTQKGGDKSKLVDYVFDRITYCEDHIEAWAANIPLEVYEKLDYSKRKKQIKERLNTLSVDKLLLIEDIASDLEWNGPEDLIKKYKVKMNAIDIKVKELSNAKFPDPAKQLLVSFSGLRYGLKESDYLKELEWISDKIRGLNKKEGSEYKDLNIINPGGNNVMFRKDAKSGLYRFSTWIDTDGTAMGFDKLEYSKFRKLVKGFKSQAAGDKKQVKKK